MLAADSGRGKSLLTYDLARSVADGRPFLGFHVPKLNCLILQLEEGATMASRLRAFGFHHWGERGVQWNVSTNFDLAKPSQCSELKHLIRSGYQLIIVDPLRAVSSLNVDENHADFGKRVLRPLRKLITEAGGTGVVIHHTSRRSQRFAGTGDIKAAVWGMFSLFCPDENDPDLLMLSSLPCHDGKVRDGEPILWKLRKHRCTGPDGMPGNCHWELLAMEQHKAPELGLIRRVEALLAAATMPLTLREIAAQLQLPDGADGKVNASLRSLASQSPAIGRWAQPKGDGVTTYWMPYDCRPAAFQARQGMTEHRSWPATPLAAVTMSMPMAMTPIGPTSPADRRCRPLRTQSQAPGGPPWR